MTPSQIYLTRARSFADAADLYAELGRGDLAMAYRHATSQAIKVAIQNWIAENKKESK